MHTINQVKEIVSNYIDDRSLWDIPQEAGNEYLPVVEGCPTPACELMLFVVVPPALVEWPSSWVPSAEIPHVAFQSVAELVSLHALLLSHNQSLAQDQVT